MNPAADMRRAVLAPALLLLGTAGAAAQTVHLEDAFPLLTFEEVVDLQQPGDGTDRLFVVRQPGVIDVVPNTPSVSAATTFLDLRDSVEWGGELGLLGLAFHPAYGSNGYFYVNYTKATPLRSVISRFSRSATNPDSADPASELVLLEVGQPYDNHNGGQLAFGHDGLLYIALGDGGSGGDPENRAQDRTDLLGKILRIDVDSAAVPLPYAIPPGNPFAGNSAGYREEIFAYGLRNPWRLSFDPDGGTGWMGDVGQDDREEVDTLVPGGNYGWRLKEGTLCFEPPSGCDTVPGLQDPIWEYAHGPDGDCSVTGGVVYRGGAIPSLAGRYLYGDYCTGKIWTLFRGSGGAWTNALLLDSNRSISSFGVDRDGEVYVCSPVDGKIFRIAAAGGDSLAEGTWSYSGGWNLVSLPLGVSDGAAGSVFPGAVTPAYRFVPGAGYVQADSLSPGIGYWLKFGGPDDVVISGLPRPSDTIGVVTGWNLIGGPEGPVPVDSIAAIPPGIVASKYFGYDGAYAPADTIRSGRGYWVKSTGPGTLILHARGSGPHASPGSIRAGPPDR